MITNNHTEEDLCSICYNKYCPNEQNKEFELIEAHENSKHFFHRKCIEAWCITKDNRGEFPTCPICRIELNELNQKLIIKHNLFYWVLKNNIENINLALEYNSNINIINNDGLTPLHVACTDKNINRDIVELLIKNSNNIDSKGTFENTPLYIACTNGNIEAVKLLLKYNADINSKNKDENTPLHVACWQNHSDIVEILLNCNPKPDINARNIYKETPLHYACQLNNFDVVQILLKHNANIKVNDIFTDTPLKWANDMGYKRVSQLLIKELKKQFSKK